MDSKSIFILWHIGLGDALLCNGLVRWYAKLYEHVKIPSYEHNLQAVSFMFSDLKNVEVVKIRDEADMLLKAHGKNCLKLGYYSDGPFNPKIFDQEFYRQADVPFEQRWSGFSLPQREPKIVCREFALIHHDPKRNFIMRPTWHGLPPRFVQPNKPFFDWVDEAISAREIHCINSSFLILVDSLPDVFVDQRLFFHHYARPTDHPCLKRHWTFVPEDPEKLSSDIREISQVNAK